MHAPEADHLDHPLQCDERPAFEEGNGALRLVDLFCGCGGLTLGVAQAAHNAGLALEIPLAVDFDKAAIEVYEGNFKKAETRATGIENLFSGQLSRKLRASETRLQVELGRVDVLVGGPPCQGHSNLNNWTRRNDPKNLLYLRMIRAVQVLRPRVVLVENVPAVIHDVAGVVETARAVLTEMGYDVADRVIPLLKVGVAQRRKRHVLLATNIPELDPYEILTAIADSASDDLTLRWAISDLAAVTSELAVDVAPKASPANRERMEWLLKAPAYDLPNPLRPPCHRGSHSYRSMYGRLHWDQPAQTITSGFGSIGQGRYMHPDLPRALTPHEAARIQGFPDYFNFEAARLRAELATMIGNAVPPQLGKAILARVLSATPFDTWHLHQKSINI